MGIGVGLGLADFPFSDARAFWRWVDLCEEGGVDSLWQTDRLVSRQPILECMSAMAAIAGRTRRIKFGMNVASVGLRDPLLLAKQCATIDVLSEGRLLPAFGVGSPRGPEWQVRGEAFDKGARRTNEGLGNPLPALVGGEGQLRGRVLRHEGRLDLAAPGAGPAAALDRRVEPGGDPQDREMGHGLAGRRRGAGGSGAGGRRHPRGRRGGGPAGSITSISAPG